MIRLLRQHGTVRNQSFVVTHQRARWMSFEDAESPQCETVSLLSLSSEEARKGFCQRAKSLPYCQLQASSGCLHSSQSMVLCWWLSDLHVGRRPMRCATVQSEISQPAGADCYLNLLRLIQSNFIKRSALCRYSHCLLGLNEACDLGRMPGGCNCLIFKVGTWAVSN